MDAHGDGGEGGDRAGATRRARAYRDVPTGASSDVVRADGRWITAHVHEHQVMIFGILVIGFTAWSFLGLLGLLSCITADREAEYRANQRKRVIVDGPYRSTRRECQHCGRVL